MMLLDFGLKPHMMKPYPGQKLTVVQIIFNHRLSRARRVIENAFGIMVSKFRIFRRPMITNVDKVVKVTKACVALHNFLMKTNNANSNGYCPANYVDTDGPSGERPGDWRREENSSFALQPLNNAGSNNYSRNAKQIREDFTNYFLSTEGSLNWQLERVTRII